MRIRAICTRPGPEFWFMLEGQTESKIGSVPVFVADQGDVVYAQAKTWHRIRFVGSSMSTRLAIVGYPQLACLPAAGRISRANDVSGRWFGSPFDTQLRCARPHRLNAKLDVPIQVHS